MKPMLEFSSPFSGYTFACITFGNNDMVDVVLKHGDKSQCDDHSCLISWPTELFSQFIQAKTNKNILMLTHQGCGYRKTATNRSWESIS